MRQMGLAFAGCLLLGGPALGAPGDVLMVTGNNVNVRTGPGLEHDVSRQVDRDQRVIEIEREGDWVRAEIAGAAGWIHGSLVTLQAPAVAPAAPSLAEEPTEAPPPADTLGEAAGAAATSPAPLAEAATEPAPDLPSAPEAIAPAAAPEVDAVDLQRFRDSVEYLNSRALAVAGVDLFTEVEPLGGGAVQVGATDAWATIPPGGQRSYASTLLDRWAAATGGAGQVKVQIVDAAGQVLMEESKP
ncbi:MAG: SH3 domain-containing protein [Geminicoccaceae bacterium]